MSRFIKFNDTVEGPELHLGLGTFTASFTRDQQPFEVSEADWEILKFTRHFDLDEEAEAKAAEKARKAAEKAAKEAAAEAAKQNAE